LNNHVFTYTGISGETHLFSISAYNEPIPVLCEQGIPYILSNVFDYPSSNYCNLINFSNNRTTNIPDNLGINGGINISLTDFNGVDRTSYFEGLVNYNVFFSICQNGVTSLYSAQTSTFNIIDTPNGKVISFNNLITPNQLLQISYSNSLFNYSELVYINFEIIP
jgi:hypothetical protein